MKKITTLLFLSIAFQSFAIDRFVDPNLSAGNGTTLFTNITSAIAAAVNGDRIIVASNTYNEAALTIGKSLQIMPQTPGTTINFNANITIGGFPGMKLEITGFNLGIYSLSANNIINGIASNRAKISIIDSSASDIYFNENFYEVNVINCAILNSILLKYGNAIKNNCKKIIIMDEPLNNIDSNRILITNNTLSGVGLIGVFNDNWPIIISNNTINNLSIVRYCADLNRKNKINNNLFLSNSKIFFSADGPSYNIVFTSNKFTDTFLSYTNYGNCTDSSSPSYNFTNPDVELFHSNDNFMLDRWMTVISFPTCGQSYSSGASTKFPNPNLSGSFEWSYNGLTISCPTPNSSQPLSLVKIVGLSNDIDGGNPNHDYYDIDLTINDRGINGGPFSQLNYNAANPNNSKACIFDLDMPSDLFPGQNVEIKAKGYHKN
jgi:hypothetical protein